jgi:1,2-diacylglycerol 3-alpha-glucosyltransferase
MLWAIYLSQTLSQMPAPSETRPTRALLACSGLDHARRGFETFARECFEALRDEPALELELVKGSGPSGDRERSVATLKRDAFPALALGRAFGREPFRFEQLAFGLSLQPLLMRMRPDVVYLSEWHTALALARLRRLTRLRHRLVLCNGALASHGFEHLDHVQQLTPGALEFVLERGADPARHTLLPLGFAIEGRFTPTTRADRAALRRRLGLPLDRRIVLSVAALNRTDKRLDYLIDEVAALSEPRPFLLLIGQPEPETPGIRALARDRLGSDGADIRTVSSTEIGDYYRVSDEFVLASLVEALPRAPIEALAHGLPCTVHDYSVTRFALGEHGRFGDLQATGALAALLRESRVRGDDPERQEARHRYVHERFSWDRLRPRYLELLSGAAAAPPARSIISRVSPTTRAGTPSATE